MVQQVPLVGEEAKCGDQACRKHGRAEAHEGRPPDDRQKPLKEMRTKRNDREQQPDRGQVEIAFAQEVVAWDQTGGQQL